MELMEYLASAVIVLVSNLCVEINKKISFLALSVWTDGLMSNPKIIAFLPQSKFASEKKLNNNHIKDHIQNKNIYLDHHF